MLLLLYEEQKYITNQVGFFLFNSTKVLGVKLQCQAKT